MIERNHPTLSVGAQCRLRSISRSSFYYEPQGESLKYECVYLHAWETGSQTKAGVSGWINVYNHQRPHAAHGVQLPAVAYFNQIETGQQRKKVA